MAKTCGFCLSTRRKRRQKARRPPYLPFSFVHEVLGVYRVNAQDLLRAKMSGGLTSNSTGMLRAQGQQTHNALQNRYSAYQTSWKTKEMHDTIDPKLCPKRHVHTMGPRAKNLVALSRRFWIEHWAIWNCAVRIARFKGRGEAALNIAGDSRPFAICDCLLLSLRSFSAVKKGWTTHGEGKTSPPPSTIRFPPPPVCLRPVILLRGSRRRPDQPHASKVNPPPPPQNRTILFPPLSRFPTGSRGSFALFVSSRTCTNMICLVAENGVWGGGPKSLC